MRITKAFLSKKKDPEEENEEEGKSGGTLTGENSEKDQKKGKKLCKGDTLHHRRCVGLRHRAPFDLPRARRRRSCWRDLSGEFEDESVIDGDEFIAVSLRMVETPGILTKDFGEGHK